MVISMMEIGMMTRHRVQEHIIIIMELNILANGSMISSMDMEYKHGLTVQSTKVSTIWGKKMEKENIHGKMGAIMMAVGWIIKLQEREFMYGLMEEDMKEIGSIIRCMDMAAINGRMEGNMKENINMIRNMALVVTLGLMVENIMVNGPIANVTEEEKL